METEQDGGEPSTQQPHSPADGPPPVQVQAVLDHQGRFVQVSQSSLAVLGMTPFQIHGKHLGRLVHPADLPALDMLLRKAVLDESCLEVRFRVQHGQGPWVWVRCDFEPRLPMVQVTLIRSEPPEGFALPGP